MINSCQTHSVFANIIKVRFSFFYCQKNMNKIWNGQDTYLVGKGSYTCLAISKTGTYCKHSHPSPPLPLQVISLHFTFRRTGTASSFASQSCYHNTLSLDTTHVYFTTCLSIGYANFYPKFFSYSNSKSTPHPPLLKMYIDPKNNLLGKDNP